VFTFPEIAAVYIADPDTRENVTTIEAISAAGMSIPGIVIMLRKELLEKYFDNEIEDETLFAANEETSSGFAND